MVIEHENVYVEVPESAYKQNHVYRPWSQGSENKKAGDPGSFKAGKEKAEAAPLRHDGGSAFL